MDKVKVLFVCLGNICRSPMAEGLFIHKVHEAGLGRQIEVDSAGTSGWHIGEPADRRMQEVAKKHGVSLPSRSRKLVERDFEEFDYILAMDESNLSNIRILESQSPVSNAQVSKMRDYDLLAKGSDVPDPYYGGQQGFEDVYEMLDRSTDELLKEVVQRLYS